MTLKGLLNDSIKVIHCVRCFSTCVVPGAHSQRTPSADRSFLRSYKRINAESEKPFERPVKLDVDDQAKMARLHSQEGEAIGHFFISALCEGRF
jgi:hypothetical protein